MIEIINLEKLDRDGRKMPANSPNIATPDNITHCQLRSSTLTVQGVAVANYPNTFEVNITVSGVYKLYKSTDGTNYYEDKSYGGDDGKEINVDTLASILADDNDWTGLNTFNTQLPRSELTASDRDEFTTLKSTGLKYKGILSQASTNAPIVNQLTNTTGETFTWARTGTGVYTLTADTGNPFNSTLYNVFISYDRICLDGQTQFIFGYFAEDALTRTLTVMTFYTWDTNGSLADEMLFNTSFSIELYPKVVLIPALITPSNGLTITSALPFSNKSSPVTNAIEYTIQIDNVSSAFNNIYYTETKATPVFTAMTHPNGTYYWRVRARIGVSTYSDWSSTFSFTMNV